MKKSSWRATLVVAMLSSGRCTATTPCSPAAEIAPLPQEKLPIVLHLHKHCFLAGRPAPGPAPPEAPNLGVTLQCSLLIRKVKQLKPRFKGKMQGPALSLQQQTGKLLKVK